jgi:hypothetical protein
VDILNDGLNLVKMARELLMIHEDLPFRFKNPKSKINHFDLRTFEQMWGSTALGFGGIGGQAMTSARTYVFVPSCGYEEHCHVYFGGGFAYSVPYSAVFIDDVCNESVVSKPGSGKYIKAAEK